MSSSESNPGKTKIESEDVVMTLEAEGIERPVTGLDIGTSGSLSEDVGEGKDEDYEPDSDDELEEEKAWSGKKRKTENPLGTRGKAAFFTFNEVTNHLDIINIGNERIFCPDNPTDNNPVFIECRNFQSITKGTYNMTVAIETYYGSNEYYFGFGLEYESNNDDFFAYVFNGTEEYNELLVKSRAENWEDVAHGFTAMKFPTKEDKDGKLNFYFLNQIAGNRPFRQHIAPETRNMKDNCFQCLRDGPDLFLPKTFEIQSIWWIKRQTENWALPKQYGKKPIDGKLIGLLPQIMMAKSDYGITESVGKRKRLGKPPLDALFRAQNVILSKKGSETFQGHCATLLPTMSNPHESEGLPDILCTRLWNGGTDTCW